MPNNQSPSDAMIPGSDECLERSTTKPLRMGRACTLTPLGYGEAWSEFRQQVRTHVQRMQKGAMRHGWGP
jgi:hypothetical protein